MEPSMRLYLVRHGAVSPPRPHVFYGGTDVPLSQLGQAEAKRAAQVLAGESVQRVVSSPMSRALYGAQCFLASRDELDMEIEEDLREIDRGRWIGHTPEEIRANFPGDLEAHAEDPDHWREHGGESLGDLRNPGTSWGNGRG